MGFAAAAVFHAVALFAPRVDMASPAWRHGLFVAINLLAAAGMVFRPRGFALAFAVLTAQQICSHGATLVDVWRRESRVDWASAVVLLSMPVALALLVRDRRAPTASGMGS